MKTLVIYYSFEGNTRFIAETIANSINADILELKPKEEIKSKGFMKYIWGGRQVVRQKEPELIPFDKMKVLLNGNTILGETDFEEPLKHDKAYNSNKAKEWAKEMLMRY